MARFDKFAPLLRKLEGGFVNNPNDKGGATNCGVTLATYRQFYGKDKAVEDLKKMTEAEWRNIMKRGYWDVAKADYIENQSVAEIIVDWCINSGTWMLRKVQSIVGVEVDGIVGPRTLNAINTYRQKCLHCKVLDARRDYYARLIKADPSQKVFEKGWNNRLSNFVFSE